MYNWNVVDGNKQDKTGNSHARKINHKYYNTTESQFMHLKSHHKQKIHEEKIGSYLELSSNKKELLTALLESSVMSILILEMTWRVIKHKADKHLNLLNKCISYLPQINLHLELHFGYYSCRPSTEYIFCTVAEHLKSENTKTLSF